MKKATKKTTTARSTSSSAPQNQASVAPAQSTGPSATKPLVTAQPQSKQQAAVQGGMFLHTDDTWSQPYFANGDLHCVERKLFG